MGKAKSERLAGPLALLDLTFPDEAAVAGWLEKVQAATKLTVRRM